MSHDAWLTELEHCSQLGRELMSKIHDRNNLPRTSSDYSRTSTNIRTSLQQYSSKVKSLRHSLQQPGSTLTLTERETARRQGLLNELVTKEKQLEEAFHHKENTAHRSALMSSNAMNPFAEQHPDDYHDDDPLLDVSEIRQQQRTIIREQDSGLDALSNILGRQRQMASDIGNELDSQNVIIDDLGERMEHTDGRIRRETQHVRIVDRKSATCGLWVVIILLAIAIIIVGVVPFH